MPDTKISAMPAATSLGSSDILPIVQSGVNKSIAGSFFARTGSANSFTASNTFNNGVFNWNAQVPPDTIPTYPYNTNIALNMLDGSGVGQFSIFSQGNSYWNIVNFLANGTFSARQAFGPDGTASFQVKSNSVIICGGSGGGFGNTYIRVADDGGAQGVEVGDGMGGQLNVINGSVLANMNNTAPGGGSPYFGVYDSNSNLAFQIVDNGGAGMVLTTLNVLDDTAGGAIFKGNVGVGSIDNPMTFTIGSTGQDNLVMACDGGTQHFQMGDISAVNYENILDINGSVGTLDYSIAGASAFSINSSGVTTIDSLAYLLTPIWKPGSDSTSAMRITDAADGYRMMGFDTTNGRIVVGALGSTGVGAFDILGKNAVLTSGTATFLNVFPYINQAGTAGFTALWVSPYMNAVGTGTKLLADIGINSAAHGGGTHQSKFNIDISGNVVAVGDFTADASNFKITNSGQNMNMGQTVGGAAAIGLQAANYGLLIWQGAAGAGNQSIFLSGNGVGMKSSSYAYWCSTASPTGTPDTVLTRVSAGVVSINTSLAAGAAGSLQLTNLTASSYVQASGEIQAYVAKTSTYTLTATDYTVNCTSGTFTVTLPTAVGATGRLYVIKNSGTGTITLATTSSQTIDAGTTLSISTQYQSVKVQSTGANWIVI